MGLPEVKKTLKICITVYTQYRRVTDAQTDGQTDRRTFYDGIVRTMRTRCAVKKVPVTPYDHTFEFLLRDRYA